jgi:ADP-heptose:LPS heptosyltransferase
MNLLFVQPNGIGNTILSTPAMQAVRAVFPEARYDLLINPSGFPVVVGWPVFDHILTDDALVDPMLYELVVLAEPRHDALYSSVVKQAREVVAHPNSGYRTRVLRRAVQHEVSVNMALAVRFGYSGKIPPLHVNTTPDTTAYDPLRGCIALHMGAASKGWAEKKKWPRAHWVELIRCLGAQDVCILGGPDERDQVGSLCAETGALNVCGVHSIPETARLIANSRLLISTDSGPMHIAAAVGTPVIGLFGGTSGAKNHPWTVPGKSYVLSSRIICAPCQGTPRFKTCRDHRCMRSISVGQVLGAVESMKDGRFLTHDRSDGYPAMSAGPFIRGMHGVYDVLSYLMWRLSASERLHGWWAVVKRSL